MLSAFISLVISCYNRDRYLAEAIESVLTQTYPHFELLIWDDGSTDSSLDIAQHYAKRDPRIRVHAAPHQGIAPALKSAIAHTTAPYLGWVDSDDRLAPTALEETIAILDAQPDVGMVYTHYEVIDAQGNSHGLGNRCHIPYSKERLLIEFMTFHFRLLRRSVYEQVGGIDPTFQWAEDYDLCLKLSEVTQIRSLPQPLYFYRRHDHNITNNQVEAIRWAAIAIERAIVRRGLDQDYRLDVRLVGHFKLLPQSADLPSYLAAPLVSVIIPTHNRRTHLDRALQSVLHQSYPNWELIVIDDASTDGTTEWLQTHYPQVCLITLPHNQGAAAARNAGVQQAQGQFLAFLDSDDQWEPHYLHRQLHTLAQHPDAVLVYSNYTQIFSTQDQGTPVALQPPPADSIAAMLYECFIHTLSQVVVPKAVFEQVGGFNEQFHTCHDWELYLRLFALGAPVQCPEPLVRKLWLPNSLVTRSACQLWHENGLKLLDHFYAKPENACYLHLRPAAEQRLQVNVSRSRQYFAQAFGSSARPTSAVPFVSIILTCHNDAHQIAPCLQNCWAQTDVQVEIIVVDRGSTDATVATLQQCVANSPFPLRLFQLPQASLNAARNAGFEQAKGDYIQWFDVSDRWPSDKLARQVAALEAQPSAAIAYSGWEWCGVKQQQIVVQFAFPAPTPEEMLLHLLLDSGRPAGAYLLRRAAATQLHQLQAWHPLAHIDTEREYFTLAALLGLRFCSVASTSVQQVCPIETLPARLPSDLERTLNRQRMFGRFQDVAAVQSTTALHRLHWTLLRQNWGMWLPAFAIAPLDAQAVELRHTQQQTVMVIEGATLTIARALLPSPEARPLEDHARVVVQQVWRDLLLEVSQSPHPQRLADFAYLSAALAQRVGLNQESTIAWSECEDLGSDRPAAESAAAPQLSQWLLDVPLFAPLFTEHRLQVYFVLDQLRQQGWLVNSPQPPTSDRKRQQQPEGDRPAALLLG